MLRALHSTARTAGLPSLHLRLHQRGARPVSFPRICPHSTPVTSARTLRHSGGKGSRHRSSSFAAGLAGVVSASAMAASAAAAPPPSGSLDQVNIQALGTAHLVVATTPACPYCKRAKEALQSAGIPYAELQVDQDKQLREKLKEVAGRSSVPQVFLNGVSIGGSDDLLAAIKDGSLQQKLEEARSKDAPALPSNLLQTVKEAAERVRAAAQDSRATASAAASVPKDISDLANQAVAPAQAGGIPRSNKQLGGRTLPSFSGYDLLQWLTTKHQLQPQEAEQKAQALLHHVQITPAVPYDPVMSSKYQVPMQFAKYEQYCLVKEARAPGKGQPLNSHIWWTGTVRPAVQVAEDLRSIILRLYDAHLSADGKSVNYRAMRSSPLFQEYTTATAELQRVDLQGLSREDLMAFAINLYNSLIVHAIVVLGAPDTLAKRATFFSKDAQYVIGGQVYTSDDLENGILRCNRAPASNLFMLLGMPSLAGGKFKSSDPRAKKLVCPPDPRIHFALVCGAQSCPPIKTYTPSNLEEALQGAGEAFCAGEVDVDRRTNTVSMSKIFQWYSVDFGNNEREKLRFITRFLQGQKRQDLEAMLANGRPKVQYKPYNWNLNGEI